MTAPFFCDKTGEIERRAGLAVDMRGHAKQRADSNDAGAADAGDEDIERHHPAQGGVGVRQIGKQQPTDRPRRDRPSRSLPPCTVTKLGQKPSMQEKSLLQFDWSIRPFAAQFRFQRLHRDAIGGGPSSRRNLHRHRC